MPENWTPSPDRIEDATQHVAWEFVAMIAAAREMACGHNPPVNHQVQESFLVHVRNLAEFFCKGVNEFKASGGALVPRDEKRDNIFAVDFLLPTACWDPKGLDSETKLRRAIDKTLSHMTYARDLQSPQLTVAFDGRLHVHGTVTLLLRAWNDFQSALRPELKRLLDEWISYYAAEFKLELNKLTGEFEELARERASRDEWQLDKTPDGLVL